MVAVAVHRDHPVSVNVDENAAHRRADPAEAALGGHIARTYSRHLRSTITFSITIFPDRSLVQSHLVILDEMV